MRFKIGNEWHEHGPDKPIMVELTQKDKENISNMAPGATQYALFDDKSSVTPDAMRAWMAEDR